MYLKDEWNQNVDCYENDDYFNRQSDIFSYSMENNIRKLYSLGKSQAQQAEKIIENCEFILDLMEKEISEGAMYEIFVEYYRILILAYKLYQMDEGDHEVAGHILQVRVMNYCEDSCECEKIAQMLFLLDDLMPDFDLMFFKGDWDVYSLYDYKLLVKCRRYIKQYNYKAAFDTYIELVVSLNNKDPYKFENDFSKKSYIEWIKKQYKNLLKTAKLAGKLPKAENDMQSILEGDDSLLDEADKRECRLLLKCEMCFADCNNNADDIIAELINTFEAEQGGETENNREGYKKSDIFMDYLLQLYEMISVKDEYWKRLAEIIQEISIESMKKKNFWEAGYYKEILIMTLFRGLSLEDTYEIKDVEILKSLQDWVQNENAGKASFAELFFTWGIGTEDDKKKKERRIMLKCLADLYNKVTELQNYIKVKEYKKEEIAYYTSLQTLGYLLMDEDASGIEKCRLSLMNVGYMNDPNEGQVIYEVFEKNIYSNTNEFFEFIGRNEKRIPKKADKDLIFLKSFSDKVDRLTMWSEYGDKGNGACIVLNGETFQNAKHRVQLLRDLQVHTSGNDYDDYDLYKVIYWSKNEDKFWANGLDSDVLKKKMDDIFTLLKDIFAKLSDFDLSDADKHVIISNLKTIFSKLKYLIKFEEYEDENETRLVFQRKTANSFGDIEEVPNEDVLKTKLYIHYPVQTIIGEIILGPKNMESDEYIPFITRKTVEINGASGYNTDICKSAIDYR